MRRLAIGVMLLVMAVAGGRARGAAVEGLIGHWTFDEGSGKEAVDSSGVGNNARFDGSPKWTDGHSGKAIEFDGNSRLIADDSDSFHLVEGVTIALWAKPEKGQPDWAKFLIKQKSGEYPYSLQFDDQQGIFGTVNASARFDTQPKLPNFPGEWAHLAMTYDGAAVVLYKDGLEVARNDSATGDLQQNNLEVSIGGRINSGQNFIGVLDDVYLFSLALDASEIRNLMEGKGLAVEAVGRLPLRWARLKAR